MACGPPTEMKVLHSVIPSGDVMGLGPPPCMKIAGLVLSPLSPTAAPAIFRAARNLLLLPAKADYSSLRSSE